MIKLFQNLILFFLLSLGTFYFLEKSIPKLNLSDKSVYYWKSRYMLIKSNKNIVFDNKKKFFTYHPNSTIHAKTYYYINNEFLKEYDYKFKTNNFGLSQANNIFPKTPSIIFLGDSFTEGQGFGSWLDNLIISKYQKINGGFVGTGFKQWENFLNYLLNENFNINKLIILFISSDIERNVWNFSQNNLECLENYNNCKKNQIFYGMPENDSEILSFLHYVFLQRFKEENKNRLSFFFKNNFPNIRELIHKARNQIRNFKKKTSQAKIDNAETIARLTKKYNENILFLHIPEKEEIFKNLMSKSGLDTKVIINKNNGKYIDLQKKCKFNLSDYYKFDGHFNSYGYIKLEKCIQNILKHEQLE